MKERFIKYLACPDCGGDLEINNIVERTGELVKTGDLKCKKCNLSFPISNHIPRFVPINNYASNFGIEWMAHAKTQYDSHSGIDASRKRFFEETKWDKDLEGEIIVEVGSGSGRFTEQAASTKGFVISIDYSFAVEANYASNGHFENVFIIQGDIYALPLKKEIAHKMLCIGVLQHTPDPEKAFHSLIPFVKNGGSVVVDLYKDSFRKFYSLKYYLRPFTRNSKDPEKLYRRVKNYINFMWPVCSLIRKIPKYGIVINWNLLVSDYSGLGLQGDILKEWAYLETYDILSPRYDYPQTISKVTKWLRDSGLQSIDVCYGYNGIEARGKVMRES